MKTLLITPLQNEDIENLISNNKKIAAIKYIRALTTPVMSLKDAKHSIDNYSVEFMGKPGKVDYNFGYKVVCGPRIKKIVCDFGQGDIEIDLESMELKVLSSLHTLGIDACGKILDLVQVLKDFSDGRIDEDR